MACCAVLSVHTKGHNGIQIMSYNNSDCFFVLFTISSPHLSVRTTDGEGEYFVVAVKRLMREAQELAEPTEQYFAQPLEVCVLPICLLPRCVILMVIAIICRDLNKP